MKGWEHLNPAGAGLPGTCFVAMSFDPSLDDAYEHGIVLRSKLNVAFES